MMAKFTGLRNALKDAKTRILLFILVIIIAISVVFVLWKLLQKEKTVVSEVALQTAPKLISTPGDGEPTREYLKIQQQADVTRAKEALKTGGTALPTLTQGDYSVPDEFTVGPQEIGKPGCTPEELQRARNAGVKAEELRCKGCSAEALKAAGYTAAELMDSGFTAKELKAAGYTAGELRLAGFDPQELLAAGFSAAELENTGFSAAELNPLQVKAGNKTGDCSVEALRKAKNAGITAASLVKKGCDLGNLRQAGFTAKELRDAGFSAKDLAAAGFSAAELKDAGFTAAELKDAGFTAKQLKDAGFSAAELKAAGFSAGELRKAGFSAEDLKNAGFSAADLRDAGFNAQELKDAGFTMDELRGAGFSEGELVRAGFQAQPMEIATAATATPPPPQATEQPGAAELPSIPGSNSDIEALDRLRQYQAAELSRQQQEELVQQMQQAMATQAQDLFTSWQGSPGFQLVEAPKIPHTDKGDASKSSGQSAENSAASSLAAAAKNGPIVKAGSVMFAVLKTSVNSDEQSPVMATIVDGKLKGTKLVGRFNRVNKRVVLEFTTANIPGAPTSISVNAVAIDAKTARTAIATDVDSHYMLRYGTLFASAFLTGLGNAISQSNTTTTQSLFGSITTRPEYSISQQALLALGQVGTQYGQVMARNFTMPPTVHVDSGTGIGILFMQDVSLASENSPTPANVSITSAAGQTDGVKAGTAASEGPNQPGTPGPSSNSPDLADLMAQQQQRQAQQLQQQTSQTGMQ